MITSLCLIEVVFLIQLVKADFLDDQLGDVITHFYFKLYIGVVHQQYFDFSSIVTVDDTSCCYTKHTKIASY